MNRLDPVSGQLAARRPPSRTAAYLRGGTWGALALGLALAVWLGGRLEANPTDRIARALACLPLTLVLVDAWSLGIALLRRPAHTPLRVPVKTPPVLAAFHLGVWLWASYLASFEVFYRLAWQDELAGVYEVRPGVALLLGGLALGALAAAFFEVRLVRWVLISEETAAPAPGGEADLPVGPEHVYEAQMLLNNLGYGAGPIDGELRDATRAALKRFQAERRLEPSGEVTALTMIELRNRWTAQEGAAPGRSAKALCEHVARRAARRAADWWARWRG